MQSRLAEFIRRWSKYRPNQDDVIEPTSQTVEVGEIHGSRRDSKETGNLPRVEPNCDFFNFLPSDPTDARKKSPFIVPSIGEVESPLKPFLYFLIQPISSKRMKYKYFHNKFCIKPYVVHRLHSEHTYRIINAPICGVLMMSHYWRSMVDFTQINEENSKSPIQGLIDFKKY